MDEDFYTCPHCGARVPNLGQKVFVHKTFCRDNYDNFSKGNILQKSTMQSTFELVNVDLKDFPWGMTFHTGADGEITIRYKARGLVYPFVAIYMLSIGLFEHAARRFDEKYILIVFFALTAVHFLCGVIYSMFAKWELTIGNGKVTYFGGIARWGQRVEFEYNSDSTVAADTLDEFAEGIMTVTQVVPDFFRTIPAFVIGNLAGYATQSRLAGLNGIIVTTNGRPYYFGGTIPNAKVRRYMAAYLLREIAK